MRRASVFVLSGALGFLASGQMSGCAQDCGPQELVDGTYQITESLYFETPPPMETGELVFDREAKRVTITYGPADSPRQVVLRIPDNENAAGGAGGSGAQ